MENRLYNQKAGSVLHYYLILSVVPFLICMVLLGVSCIGRWLIFINTGHKGFLSLIPVVNLLIYGDISGRMKSAVGIIAGGIGLSLFSAVLGNVYILTEESPEIRDRASVVCFFVIGVLILMIFILYMRIVLGVCAALSLNKPLFIVLALFMLPVAEFLAGLNTKKNPGTSGDTGGSGLTGENVHVPHSMGQASSLEAFLTEEDRALALWDSGALIIRDGIVVNTKNKETGE